MLTTREPKIFRLQATLVVVLVRFRLLNTALVFQVKIREKKENYNTLQRSIIETCKICDKWTRDTPSSRILVTSFFFAQRLWSSKDLKSLKALAGWQWKKKIFFRKRSLSCQSSLLSLSLSSSLSKSLTPKHMHVHLLTVHSR